MSRSQNLRQLLLPHRRRRRRLLLLLSRENQSKNLKTRAPLLLHCTST